MIQLELETPLRQALIEGDEQPNAVRAFTVADAGN